MTAMLYYTVEKLGPKQSVTPEGFLLCVDVPIARTGFQTYTAEEMDEVEPGPGGLVMIERSDDEVFREETIASAWGKPVTIHHPPDRSPEWTVDPENWREFSAGVCCSPRRSKEDPTLLVADLLICDSTAIEKVRSGELIEISCGYRNKVVPTAPGKGKQTNILINHIALVDQGRCGSRCSIHDRKTTHDGGIAIVKKPKTFKDLKVMILDAFKNKDEGALKTTLDSVCDEASVEPEGEGDIHSRLKKVEDAIGGYDSRLSAHDALHTSHDERLTKLEKEEEGEEKVADEEMKPEVPEQMHDRMPQVRDSSLLHDSYRNTVAGVEVLVPGMSIFTFDRATPSIQTFKSICDLRRQALGLANRNTQDAVLISDTRGGRVLTDTELAKMTCSQVRDTFSAVVALKKRTNNASTSAAAAGAEEKKGPRSLADLNNLHKTFNTNR